MLQDPYYNQSKVTVYKEKEALKASWACSTSFLRVANEAKST